MASPTLESFCCTPNDTLETGDPPNFRTETYNIICIVSSSISVLGVIYQFLPRTRHQPSRKPQEIASHRKILLWLAIADLLASLGILVRSIVWLAGKIPRSDPLAGNAEDFAHIFCAVISAWIQFFYLCTYFWTLCYAVDIYLFMSDKSDQRPWLYKLYHAVSWGVSAVFCSCGLIFLYIPDLLRCQQSAIATIPHYLFTYIPILVVMAVNPILYIKASQKLKKKLSGQRARFTDHERGFLRAVKMKYLLVNMVFYACWIPNIFNGVMLLNYNKVTRSAFLGMWTFMAVVNPLQALLNSMVYYGVAGCNFRLPGAKFNTAINAMRRVERPKENSPLLDSYSALT